MPGATLNFIWSSLICRLSLVLNHQVGVPSPLCPWGSAAKLSSLVRWQSSCPRFRREAPFPGPAAAAPAPCSQAPGLRFHAWLGAPRGSRAFLAAKPGTPLHSRHNDPLFPGSFLRLQHLNQQPHSRRNPLQFPLRKCLSLHLLA